MNHDAGGRMGTDAGERTEPDAGDRAIPDASPLSSRMGRSDRFDAYMSRGRDLASMIAIVAASAADRGVSR